MSTLVMWMVMLTISVSSGFWALWRMERRDLLSASLLIAACSLFGMFAGIQFLQTLQGAT